MEQQLAEERKVRQKIEKQLKELSDVVRAIRPLMLMKTAGT
ncbi:MAG: hypothetical protein P4M11_11170 [Candidatus Pacebacteria bacterium]|nr:hypothetical protein [Candidatus Paceibacterota bacterium]